MAKYIIDIDLDHPFVSNDRGVKKTVYRATNFNALVFDQNGLDKLIPIEQEVSKDFKKYKNAILHVIRGKWQGGMTFEELEKVFGSSSVCSIIGDITPEELICKVEEFYGEKNNSRLEIGDEVKYKVPDTDDKITAVVTRFLSPDTVFCLRKGGTIAEPVSRNHCTKTGRNITDLASWLMEA